MRSVIYPGTFDPITFGHLDLIQRAAALFDRVIVGVAKNPSKQPLFSLEQRIALVKASCAGLDNVEVIGFSGLLVEFAQAHQVQALIRGVRGADDIDYEIQLAQLNGKLQPEGKPKLETIFLPPAVEWRYLSSTMVREIHRHQGKVAQFVPAPVVEALENLS